MLLTLPSVTVTDDVSDGGCSISPHPRVGMMTAQSRAHADLGKHIDVSDINEQDSLCES